MCRGRGGGRDFTSFIFLEFKRAQKYFFNKSVPKTGRGGQVVRAIDLQSLVLWFIYFLIIRSSRHHFKIGDLQTQCIGGYNKNYTKTK